MIQSHFGGPPAAFIAFILAALAALHPEHLYRSTREDS